MVLEIGSSCKIYSIRCCILLVGYYVIVEVCGITIEAPLTHSELAGIET